jgi:hypothetical protein
MNYKPIKHMFNDATPVDGESCKDESVLVAKMKASWEQMQTDLKALEHEWTGVQYCGSDNGAKPNWLKDKNYMYGRPLPSTLHTGPGY